MLSASAIWGKVYPFHARQYATGRWAPARLGEKRFFFYARPALVPSPTWPPTRANPTHLPQSTLRSFVVPLTSRKEKTTRPHPRTRLPDLPPTFLLLLPTADAAGVSPQVVAFAHLTTRSMPLHRRSLHPLTGHDCDDSQGVGYGCSSPPSPSIVIPPPPAASPSGWLCPPFVAPSPSPTFHGAGGGRRDQHGYSPPAYAGGGGGGGGGGGHAYEHRRRIITLIVVGTAAIAFLSLILLVVSVAVRRRQQRRRQRQQALLAPAGAAAAVAANFDDGGGNDDPEGGGGGGGVVHHIWYIRTVGLDEAAIESIAATRYRAGTGLLDAADCSVCLGEFQDGEMVRLLPKCGHAFHVPCIDTWLRAHVNCPLCRSDVLGAAAESAGGEPSSIPQADPGSNTSAAPGDAILVHSEAQEGEQEDQEAPPLPTPPTQMEENRQEQSSSPDPLPPPRNVRRAASMDAAIVSTAADAAALERLPETAAVEEEEEEQSSGDKRAGAPGASCLKVSSSGRLSNLGAGERLPRLFFSRHSRARSSVLPL